MAQERLMQLAQDLQRLGAEEFYYNQQQEEGSRLHDFLENQRQVLITADKLEKELVEEIRFNPTQLMGIDYPLDDELNSIVYLLAGLEDIKRSAVHSVEDLPAKMQVFKRLLEAHLMQEVLAAS